MIELSFSDSHYMPQDWDPEFKRHIMSWQCPCKPHFAAHYWDENTHDVQIVILMHNKMDE